MPSPNEPAKPNTDPDFESGNLGPTAAGQPSAEAIQTTAESVAAYEIVQGRLDVNSDGDTHSISNCQTKLHWTTRSPSSHSEDLGKTESARSSSGKVESSTPTRNQRLSTPKSQRFSRFQITSIDRSEFERSAATEKTATSHARRDLISGDWVIFAPERDQRPNEFVEADADHLSHTQPNLDRNEPHAESLIDPNCPFCSGAENETPPAVWSAKLTDGHGETLEPISHSGGALFRGSRLLKPHANVVAGEQTDWDVRVVPNKFPAVSPLELLSDPQSDRGSLFPVADVVGGHEVIIESSSHAESMISTDASVTYLSLLAIRDRIRYWRRVPGVNYISVFKNCGADAGASLRHCHSQLIATSLIPHRIRTKLLRCESHRARSGSALECDLVRAELEDGSRIIDQTDGFVAFCPFGSRFPGLIRMTSLSQQAQFDDFNDASLDRLASFLRRVLCWVDQAFPGKAYNCLLHTCPPGASTPDACQWSIEVFPRLSKTAGFEWSSDCMINPMLPENAAADYRRIAAADDPRRVL